MGSTEREKSIGSSIFIPNWVKNKFDNSGFDPSTLSPPTNDGEFFYVKFPRSDKAKSNQFASKEISYKDSSFENHTTSCKRFIPNIQDSIAMAKPKLTKPIGIDDGTHGDEVSCGASVVAVAQQMIAGGTESPVRGFTTDDAADRPNVRYLRQRRNSKSLPASPLNSPESSPRTRRKNATTFALQNRFNTGQLDGRLGESDEDLSKKSGSSWILAGLFSNAKDTGLAQVKNEQNIQAAEGSAVVEDAAKSKDKTKLNVRLEVNSTDMSASPIADRPLYRKKRSEIRELNFMSPVSM